MRRSLSTSVLLASVSLLGLMAAHDVWAQAAPQPNDNAAQQAVTRTQEETQESISHNKRKARPHVNADEAAKTLGADSVMDVLPTDDKLDALAERIKAEPNNLDLYFSYAQMASAMGMYEKAATTYEAMLKLAPDLDRVRLDLGSTYLKLGRLEDAQRELQAVLKKNPPDAVKANINLVLSQLGVALQEHVWSGSVAVGLNADSNANSSSSSGKILIFDTPIPLSGEQKEQEDLQAFASAGLVHSYQPLWARSNDLNVKWDTSLNLYEAKQSSLENLDLKVLSLQTGPEFRFAKSGLMLNPNVGYNHIALNNATYLKTMVAGIDGEYPLSEAFTLTGSFKHEWRDFENAPGITVYADRTGSADEANAGLRYKISAQDIVNGTLTHRRERTRQDYYDNDQWGANASYVHLFNERWFSNAMVGYKNTTYDGNDGLISSKTRHDKESTAGLTLGRRLNDSMTATLGYQYRTVDSNLLNYDYDNHRITTVLSVRF